MEAHVMKLKKIISGGQTGADRAALDTALRFGIAHGGAIPKGRRAEDGRVSEKYNLEELESPSYPERTLKNVMDSGGTLIFSHGPLSGGSLLTYDYAQKHDRPCLHLDLLDGDYESGAKKIMAFLSKYQIENLNVAGPRASGDPAIYADVCCVLERVLRE